MSRGIQPSLFFLSLPDLKKLVCVTLTLQEDDDEPRSKQIKICRELVLLYSDVLASPALDSITGITAVTAVQFFQTGALQVFVQRRSLQLSSPQCVFPGALQCCLSFSLITRLTPSWNKAGLYLISGEDFLTEPGRLNAVSLELSTSGRQMCISIETYTVRLPPPTLEDFDLPPLVLRKFWTDPNFVLHTGGVIWCHVLPSMKKGQIISISRQPPRDGPFRTYRDLQIHWTRLYGYRLPELPEEELVYCSVYFKLVGERLFTYPLSCIRLQPVQHCPRVNLQGALGSFLSDVRARLQSVCGFPARLTIHSSYHTASLNAASSAQVLNGEHINLTTSPSFSPVLTQLPAPPPSSSQPVRPFFRSKPPAWTSPLHPLDYGCGFGDSLTQSQGCRVDGDWISSSSSSSCLSFSSSSTSSSFHLHCFQTASSITSSISSSSSHPGVQPTSSQTSSFHPHFQPASSTSSSSSSSSSLSIFQPASSISSSSSSSLSIFQPASSLTSSVSSSVLLPPPPPPPKLVPLFKTKRPSPFISQKWKEQLSRGGVEGGRVTPPSFRKKTGAQAPSFSSLSAVPLPDLPPPTIPRFKRISSLSPGSKSRPGLVPPLKPGIRLKSTFKPRAIIRDTLRDETSSKTPSSDVSNTCKRRVDFSLKPKKSRAPMPDVDVGKMARSNQLSKLNSATMLMWLRERGVVVGAKHKKTELMLKVMSCLAEA